MWPFSSKKPKKAAVEQARAVMDGLDAVISACCTLMQETDPGCFYDEQMLPQHSKEFTEKALLVAIRFSKDPKERELLWAVLQWLPQFQPGVGVHPIRLMPANLIEDVEAVKNGTMSPALMAERLAAHNTGPSKARWNELNATAQQERARYLAMRHAFPTATG